MGSLKGIWSKAGTKCNRKKVKMIASDEKTEKELEREFEEEELKCTKAFVLVGGTMTTCTASSRKKQAQIRDRRMEKYERVLERCKQIPGGFEQKAMALQVFATPVLTFDSELTLYTETTLTRLDRISGFDVHIAGKRTFGPSRSSCEILWYQNDQKSLAPKNRPARNCHRIDQNKGRQRGRPCRSQRAGLCSFTAHEDAGMDSLGPIGDHKKIWHKNASHERRRSVV